MKQKKARKPALSKAHVMRAQRAEPFCTCTWRLPLGTSADGSHYCRGCGLKVQNGA